MANKKIVGELIYEIKGDDNEYNKVINRADKSAENLGKKVGESAKKSTSALDSTIRSLAGAYLGYEGLTKAIDATIGSAVRYESAFAGVRKTVDGTEEQLKALSDEFIDMSKVMPTTADEFAKIGEIAGQLGVPIEQIGEFSKTVAMIADTTNLTQEQASTDFARFANIMQMPLENIDRLGSAVVDLGNKGASTEQEIISMALRIAGAGATLGLTEPQVLGWANALSSLGIEAEMGGSAISRTMLEIATATSDGGKSLEKFAKVSGMTADEFKKKFKEDANGAIVAFINGLRDVQNSGGDTISVLDSLGITEIRQRDTLLRLANSGDVLTTSIDNGNVAWKENDALQTEAEKRYKTTSSQLAILKNNWVDLGRQLGTVILPIVNLVIEFFRQMAQTIVMVSNGVKTAIFGMGASVLAGLQQLLKGIESFINGSIDLANKALKVFGKEETIKPVTLGVKSLDSAIESLRSKTVQTGKDTVTAFFEIGNASLGASDNAKKLSDAQTLLGKTTGETNEEINNLVNGLKDGSKASKEAQKEAEELLNRWKDLKEETVDLKDAGTKAIRDLSEDNIKDLEKIEDKIKDVKQQLAELKEEYDKDIKSEDQSIAERIIEEKRSIEELQKKIDEARRADKIDYAEVSRMEAELSKRQLALNETIPLQEQLTPALEEATRRAGLTDLQRDIEDYNARKAQRTLEYEEKKADLEAKLLLEEQNKLDIVKLNQDKQDQINAIIELGNQRFKDLADNRVKITQDEVTKQVRYYNQLADAIAKAKSATRTSELPQFASGGYVANGGEVHAGEYVIPANMVAKYGGLVKALEAIRSGGNVANTVNNNITMNNAINEQIDMEAVLKNLSFELNK